MIGTAISHYTILEKLGEGGMGIVYKAHDTKLERDVALKFLPAHLSASEQDKARFMQEAKAAATLDHPNICTIHSIEEHEGQLFIAMQFVDGQLLRDRMSGLNEKQAIEIGIQVADGLAAAHEKGIVHRDIKPENIMVRKDGIVQIMDFGLAKLKGVSRLTKEGSTVGTAGYMSPEQVQGQDADHRSDIFSLGVLLYEMLVGQLPFKGVHETAIAYEIVNVDAVPMSAVKKSIAAEMDAIVLECLEKDPRERTQSASQVGVELKRYRRESNRQRASRIMPARPAGSAPPGLSPIPGKPSWIPWAITAVVGVVAVAWILFGQSTGSDAGNETLRVNITAIAGPEQQILRSDMASVSISPDGKSLVYALTESGSSRLYLRPMNSFEASVINGTENGRGAFFSPDGQWIGFAADGKLKKVPLSGGSVETICSAVGFRGGSWGPDDRIVFSPEYSSGLMSVASSGGEVKTVSSLDSTRKERTHRWPQILPSGKWVLYTIGDSNNPNSYANASFALQSTETGERHILNERGEMALFIDPGFLLVARNGILLAAPFDMKEFRVTQQLAPVIGDLGGEAGSGVSYFSVSANGHLAYLSGSVKQELELVWMDMTGKMTPLPLKHQAYDTPRISPDGSRIAVTIGTISGDHDIWVHDLRTSAFGRLTFEKQMLNGIWSRDGKRIYYASTVPGQEGLMTKPADGASGSVLLSPGEGPQIPISVSPDGLRVTINGTQGGIIEGDIYLFDVNEGKGPLPLFSSPFTEYGGQISPDGRHILYISNETGSMETYVRTFPDLKGKWQISTNGGFTPIWSPDGKAIFYVTPVGRMMKVPLQTHPTLLPGAPVELFDVTQLYFPNSPYPNYDIAPDGKRFLFLRSADTDAAPGFNVVLHWVEELKSNMQSKE